MTAQARGRLDKAQDWYRKSLAISEELGDRPDMASTYHQLGITAQDRGRLDEAQDWYRKSLAIERGARQPPRHGAHLRGSSGCSPRPGSRPRQALEWMVRCVTLFDQFPQPDDRAPVPPIWPG